MRQQPWNCISSRVVSIWMLQHDVPPLDAIRGRSCTRGHRLTRGPAQTQDSSASTVEGCTAAINRMGLKSGLTMNHSPIGPGTQNPPRTSRARDRAKNGSVHWWMPRPSPTPPALQFDSTIFSRCERILGHRAGCLSRPGSVIRIREWFATRRRCWTQGHGTSSGSSGVPIEREFTF